MGEKQGPVSLYMPVTSGDMHITGWRDERKYPGQKTRELGRKMHREAAANR